MTDLVVAIGLVLVLEGLLYAAFPTTMRVMITEVLRQPENALRWAGVIAAGLGVLVIWAVRG